MPTAQLPAAVASSVSELLARREWLLKKHAAADKCWIRASKAGARDAAALEVAADAAGDAWLAIEGEIAATPAGTLDEVIGKLAIGADALLESAGSLAERQPYERLVVSALADLRRLSKK